MVPPPALPRCDDLPTDAVLRAHPMVASRLEAATGDPAVYSASLDLAVWFHRPVRADGWHLYDVRCTHVATVAQEVLMRDTLADRQAL
jgi:acyl-CoA thioesterase-2